MLARQELYDLVWSEPMTNLGTRFGVSTAHLVQVCGAMNVPRPPAGYWNKLAVGKALPPPPLPDPSPTDLLNWDERAPERRATKPTKPRKQRSPGVRTAASKPTHKLVRGLLSEFLRSKPVENGGYLKPFKKLLPFVSASQAEMPRALSIASAFYNELEALGASIAIAAADRYRRFPEVDEREMPQGKREYAYLASRIWSPMRPTIATFEDITIFVTIVEMSAPTTLRYVSGTYLREAEYQANLRRYAHHHSWTTSADLPIGRFRILASTALMGRWSMTWEEEKKGGLEPLLSAIATEIASQLGEIKKQDVAAQLEAEKRHQEWLVAMEKRERAEDLRRSEDALAASKTGLKKVVAEWAEREALEQFFEKLAVAIQNAAPSEKRALEEKLSVARQVMGSPDPLEKFRSWVTPKDIYEPKYHEHVTKGVTDETL